MSEGASQMVFLKNGNSKRGLRGKLSQLSILARNFPEFFFYDNHHFHFHGNRSTKIECNIINKLIKLNSKKSNNQWFEHMKPRIYIHEKRGKDGCWTRKRNTNIMNNETASFIRFF